MDKFSCIIVLLILLVVTGLIVLETHVPAHIALQVQYDHTRPFDHDRNETLTGSQSIQTESANPTYPSFFPEPDQSTLPDQNISTDNHVELQADLQTDQQRSPVINHFTQADAIYYAPHVFDHLYVDQEIELIDPTTREPLPATIHSVSERLQGEVQIIAGRVEHHSGEISRFTLVNDPDLTTLTLHSGGQTQVMQIDNETGKEAFIESATPEQTEELSNESSGTEGLPEQERFIPSPATSRDSFGSP